MLYLDIPEIPNILDLIDYIAKNLKIIIMGGGIIVVILIVILIMRAGRLTKEAVKNTFTIPGFILTVIGLVALYFFFRKWGII